MVDNSIICTRDDKSKKLVLIYEQQYYDLLSNFIMESKSVLIPYNPTDKISNRFNTILKSKRFPTL